MTKTDQSPSTTMPRCQKLGGIKARRFIAKSLLCFVVLLTGWFKMKLYSWLYVIISPYSPQPNKGRLLKQSKFGYATKEECIQIAEEWLSTADFDVCDMDMEPILVIEELED